MAEKVFDYLYHRIILLLDKRNYVFLASTSELYSLHTYVSCALINLLQTQQTAEDTGMVMKSLLAEQQRIQKEQNAVGAVLRRFANMSLPLLSHNTDELYRIFCAHSVTQFITHVLCRIISLFCAKAISFSQQQCSSYCQILQNIKAYGWKFWQIGTFESNLPIFPPPKFDSMMSSLLHNLTAQFSHIKYACSWIRQANLRMEFTIDRCAWGHHVSKEFRTPEVGEELSCQREEGNQNDVYGSL